MTTTETSWKYTSMNNKQMIDKSHRKMDEVLSLAKFQCQLLRMQDIEPVLVSDMSFPSSHLTNYGWRHLKHLENIELGVMGFDWERTPEMFDYWERKIRNHVAVVGKPIEKAQKPDCGKIATLSGSVFLVFSDDKKNHIAFDLVTNDGFRVKVLHNTTFSHPLIDRGMDVEVCGEVCEPANKDFDFYIHYTHRVSNSKYGYVKVGSVVYD